MKRDLLLPLILCGGTGSRLWPLSRESYPKQYLSLISDTSKTLMQQTLERLSGIENQENPIFICNEEHRFIVAEQLRTINVKPQKIILEPFARNTAPAITIAALKAMENGSDPILFVLASDHLIKNNQQFIKSISAAKDCAAKGNLVTFGIIPTSPEVGYGYIESVEPLEIDSFIASPISKFIEKPNFDKAKQLVSDPRFTWNSGMFLFKSSVMLSALQRCVPKTLAAIQQAMQNGLRDLDFWRLEPAAFATVESTPIDKAVMEKVDNLAMVTLDAGWSDLGAWDAIFELESQPRDHQKGCVLLNLLLLLHRL